jgi:hypothetical protein
VTISGTFVFSCPFSNSGYKILTSKYRFLRRTIVGDEVERRGCARSCRKALWETRSGGACLTSTSEQVRTKRDQHLRFKMSNQTLKAAILVVSTTASKDLSADSSGGILKDVFNQEGGGKWEVTETKIVGDVVLDIQRSIMGWTDGEDAVNLIISTGGTGFAVHDSTPEVCEPPPKFGRKCSLDLRPLHLCCINMPPDLFTAC